MPADAIQNFENRSLVLRAQGGNKRALGELYVRYHQSVRRLIVSIVGPTAELDDLTQQVFYQAFQSLNRFRANSCFSTLLSRLAIKVAIFHLHQKKRMFFEERDDVHFLPDSLKFNGAIGNRSDIQEMMHTLYNTLDTLAPKERIVFVLCDLEQRNFNELRRITGMYRYFAKLRLWIARRTLRKKASGDPLLGRLINDTHPR
jgi:RNA polymerase sigma-70 factor (ECF subfamily)